MQKQCFEFLTSQGKSLHIYQYPISYFTASLIHLNIHPTFSGLYIWFLTSCVLLFYKGPKAKSAFSVLCTNSGTPTEVPREYDNSINGNCFRLLDG